MKGISTYQSPTGKYSDIRYRRLRKRFGADGICVYDYLLCEIYRINGYYAEWNADIAFEVADYFCLEEERVGEIVSYCGEIGLLSAAKLAEGYLTSEDIQRSFKDACKKSRRADVLLDEKVDTSVVVAQEVVEQKEVQAEREQIENLFFFRNYRNPKQEAERFFNHYEAVGWRRNGGLPVKDRLALARSWRPRDETPAMPQEFLSAWECFYQKSLAPELLSIRGVEEDPHQKIMLLKVGNDLSEYIDANKPAFVNFIRENYPAWKFRIRII